MSDEFLAEVLTWLNRRMSHLTREPGSKPIKVVAVEATSSDWHGSTDEGFYSKFAVRIIYERADGGEAWNGNSPSTLVDDEDDLIDLWQSVVH